MSKISDFLVGTILPVIEKVAEDKIVELLQKLHDTDEEKYEAAVIAGSAFIKPLIEYVEKTTTTIDDGIVEAIQRAIEQSAEDNDVELYKADEPSAEEDEEEAVG